MTFVELNAVTKITKKRLDEITENYLFKGTINFRKLLLKSVSNTMFHIEAHLVANIFSNSIQTKNRKSKNYSNAQIMSY